MIDSAKSGKEPPTFWIGLSLAGAVSAGAYGAGVLDYLFRALAAHNARVGQDGGPARRVVVKAISGTSGGGVCAAFAAADLAMWDGAPRQDRVLDNAYDVWVNRLDIDGDKGLLATRDLCAEKPVASLLDGSAIDDAEEAVLARLVGSPPVNPHSFIAGELELFLTATCLSGLPYEVRFSGEDGAPSHVMRRHAVARHFRISGLGTARFPSPWLVAWGDTGVAVDASARTRVAWQGLTLTAMATGAFPIGLPARRVTYEPGELAGRAWLVDRLPPPGSSRVGPAVTGAVTDAVVDGGVCNNEPFEYARFAIRGQDGDRLADNPRDAAEADRAVILIDPFPDTGTAIPVEADLPGLLSLSGVARRLLGAAIAEARFKPGELLDAFDRDVKSRFLIAPKRKVDGKPLDGDRALAGGGLGGFGGFFCREFRHHDFVLGQRNCQRFLQNRFVLERHGVAAADDKGPGGEPERIVSPGPELDVPIAAVPWPRLDPARLDALEAPLRRRLRRIVRKGLSNLAPGLAFHERLLVALVIPFSGLIARKAARKIVGAIRARLEERDQIGATAAGPASPATYPATG